MSSPLTPLEHEILNTLADSAETTALILHDLRNPNNADDHSAKPRTWTSSG